VRKLLHILLSLPCGASQSRLMTSNIWCVTGLLVDGPYRLYVLVFVHMLDQPQALFLLNVEKYPQQVAMLHL